MWIIFSFCSFHLSKKTLEFFLCDVWGTAKKEKIRRRSGLKNPPERETLLLFFVASLLSLFPTIRESSKNVNCRLCQSSKITPIPPRRTRYVARCKKIPGKTMPAEFLRSSSSGQDNEQCHFFFLTWKQRIKRSVKMGINIERLFLNSFLPPPSSHKLESQKSQTFISLSGSITLSRKRGSKSSTFWIISHRRYLGKRGISEICNGGFGGRLHGLKTGAWGVGRGGRGGGEEEINVLPVLCKIHLRKRNIVFFGRTLDNNRLIKSLKRMIPSAKIK